MIRTPYENLADAQKVQIIKILELGSTVDEEEQQQQSQLDPSLRIKDKIWKIFIYDKLGQQVMSPLLKVNELRDNGVTLNLPLDSERQCIPGVPAVYLVEPREENVLKIVKDVRRSLYENIYIHFLSPCPRRTLELLASSLASLNIPELPIYKLFDQYLNYICLEKRLFSLEMENSYFSFKNPNITPNEIDDYANRVTSSLHSVFATLGQVPLIRYQPESIGEFIANKLRESIGNSILNKSHSGPFTSNPFQTLNREDRPLLIIIDRSIDINTMVSHQWTYASMIYDVYDVKINRITYFDEKKKKKFVFDLDLNDEFWTSNASLLFPEVTKNINMGINECKITLDDLKTNYNIEPNENMDFKSLTPNTSNLISAMKQVPLVNERKRILDMHMKISTGILNSFRERSLETISTTEEYVTKQNPLNILKILEDPKLNPEDKLRLFIVYYLSNKDVIKDDMVKFENALKTSGCDIRPLKYLREVKKLTQLSTLKGVPNSSNNQSYYLFGKFSNIGSKISDNLREYGVSGHLENLLTNLRQLLPMSKSLPITKIVETLSEGKSNTVSDHEYNLIDPKNISYSSNPPQNDQRFTSPPDSFSNIVVFVVGGGNMIEYQNLMETIKDSPNRNIIYGSTEISSPRNFLRQLQKLGAVCL